MGKQNIAIGAADQGNGDTLFDAFTAVVSNTNEVYEGANITATAPLEKTSVADTSVTLSIADNGIGATQLNVADNGTPGWLLSSDGDGSFTWVAGVEGDITAVTAGDGLSGGGTAGAVTLDLSVDDSTIEISGDAAQIKDLGVTTDKLANDGVTYAKLGTEFTTSSPLTAAADVDMSFSAAQVFTMTSSIAVDINFTNAEIGQVKDLIVTDSGGTSSLTFDTASNTITTIQGTYSATAGAVNFIQVVCTAANTFFLSISQSI
jgi:hypothetical protein